QIAPTQIAQAPAVDTDGRTHNTGTHNTERPSAAETTVSAARLTHPDGSGSNGAGQNSSENSQNGLQSAPLQALLSTTQLGQWLDLFRPPRTGQPRTTGNGSSRDQLSCGPTEGAIRPLLPAGKYGWSLEERPEIFVDVAGTSAREAIMIVRSEDGSDLRKALISIPDIGTRPHSFVGFRLPDEAEPMQIDQTYQWSLSFICGEYFTLNDPTITGWVRRVEAPSQIEQTLGVEPSAEMEAQWLSENGYWYDLTARVIAAME
ncbi:MAG: DUF928 domain-containing protein, partial [Cyanobacteria bacterium J06560_2]